jgi:hypothetical protein
MEGGRRSEEEAVLLPGQLDEVASVSQQLESETPVEVHRRSYVPHEDLRYELLGRIDVKGHDTAV